MRYIKVCSGVLVWFIAAQVGFGLTPEEVLSLSDASFVPEQAKMRMVMYNYENDEFKREYHFVVFLKGGDRYLLLFKDPPVIRQQAQLRVGDVIWHYLGKIRRMRRMSARAVFLDTVFTQEDVMYTTLSRLYAPSSMKEVTWKGKECYLLTLVPNDEGNAYARIEAYVDKATLYPVRRVYYSYGGHPIKELEVIQIRKEGSGTSYVELVVRDLVRKGMSTRVVFDEIDVTADMPDRMFTPEYLEYAAR